MVSITDSDSTHLSETILMLEAGGDAALESLRLNMTALPEGVVPQSNYQSEQGLLSITGDYSLAEYESILSAVEYVSTNRNPDDTVQMRPIVICRVRDTSNFWSNNLTVTIAIVAFNDPPAVYLGGPTQLNNAVTYGTASSSLQIATRTQIHIDDPDTQSTIEVQIVLELETVNGDPIDLAEESLFSPSPALQQVNSTVYVTQTLSNDLFPATISQVAYRNNNPSATIGGTRVVRVTAMDVELVTNGGSSFRGMTSQPSFTFILVGEEPLAPTTPPDASTTTELLQTPPITTSAPTTTADASTTTELLQTPPITTSAPTTTADFSSTSTTDQITTTETNVQDITTTVAPVSTDTTGDVVEITTAVDHTIDTTVTTVLACPEELNIPLIPGSTLGLLVYNWTQTSVDNDHIGQPCPMVSM